MGPLQLGGHVLLLNSTRLPRLILPPQLTCAFNDARSIFILLTLTFSIGLDTCLAIQQTLYEGTRDSKYRPSILLERMVDAQWYGKKNGKGFYEYNE
jgi:3-hydroxyacyl-CoA dehydrogenase, C-terminal domain